VRLAQVLAAGALHLGARSSPASPREGIASGRAPSCQDRADDALTLLEQRPQQMLGLDRLWLCWLASDLRRLQALLRLHVNCPFFMLMIQVFLF